MEGLSFTSIAGFHIGNNSTYPNGYEFVLEWSEGNSGKISSSSSASANTNILTHSANTASWTAVTEGTYIINSIVKFVNGDANERAIYYTFCRVTKTGVNYYDNVRDYQLGSSYYRDDNNGYDDFVCNGCINIYLDAGSTFKIVLKKLFQQANDSDSNFNSSEVYTEIEYIG